MLGGFSYKLPPLRRVHGPLPRVHRADHAGVTIENNPSPLAGEYVRSRVVNTVNRVNRANRVNRVDRVNRVNADVELIPKIYICLSVWPSL